MCGKIFKNKNQIEFKWKINIYFLYRYLYTLDLKC